MTIIRDDRRTRKLRILSVSHSFFPDSTGVGHAATALVNEWARGGHDVRVATAALSEQCGRAQDPVPTRRFRCSGTLVKGLKGEIEAYRSYILAERPDVLVVHCAQVWCFDALFAIQDQLPCPLVLVSHGLSAFGKPGWGEYFDHVARFLRCTKATVVGLSSRLEEAGLCAANGLPPPHIIPNGVHLDEWNSAARDLRALWGIEQRPWVVSVSNHSTVKNHRGFWRVAASLRRQIPSLRSSIIGRPYVADRPFARRLRIKGGCWYSCCARAMWSRDVDLRDDVARSDVVSAVAEADLLLVTSHREAAPMVVLEAMAAGTPWISLRIGAVEDFVGGLVVDSLAEMSGAAVELLRDRNRASALGAAGRRAASRLGWPVIAARHVRLYDSILAQSK